MGIVARRELLVGSSILLAGLMTQSARSQATDPPPTFPGQPDWWHAQPYWIAPWNAPAKVIVAAPDEPGERLIVTGTVTAADGKTPIRGVSVFAYHTDAKGLYDPVIPKPFRGDPRLRAYMRTDARGRYEFRTVRPASYPTTKNPPHIHFVVYLPGYQAVGSEVRFEGDHLLPGGGKFARNARGIWHLTYDFVLTPLASGTRGPAG